ncbi:conjugal transfer protein TraG N-terminal domain-containing protein [Sulfurimonas sp. SAG-AH-194-I05]|nr:conjugal transfer protein TraG N-terminal domain-containing protein [Sulfurimonas sp. SAG-AH-194-I05]MDF1875625.1 conjugal transfer protein TraG N-terminal domain-containing protein [Sulfurimonas sp. SAG-AH-194-I05]
MRIAFLLLLIVSASFGESFNDEWPIYVYGDAGYYKNIYDGIAMIVTDADYMNTVTGLVFLSSMIFSAISFKNEDIAGAIKSIAVGMGTFGLLLYPSSTVHILDARTLHGYTQTSAIGGDYTSYSKVDDVPFFFAAVPSFATTSKYFFIEISMTALSPVEGGSLAESGFGTPMTIADDMFNVGSFQYSKDDNYESPEFEQELSHYIEKCVIEEALYVDPSARFGVMDPKGQQIDALQPSNFTNFDTVEILDLDGNIITCENQWDNNIAPQITTISQLLLDNLKSKHPNMKIESMASSIGYISGLESNASVALTSIQNAMMNIATSSTLVRTLEKAGTGLTGIDLSNSITAQESLASNMIDSTGGFKWMIRTIPFIEFLIFGILIFLGIPMAFVAGFSGPEKGAQMVLNYAFGLVAFSFIDVGLSIVQSISLYYYNSNMINTMVMLGQNPFTATNIPIYMKEMAYMSGLMGLAGMITVPLVVGVVFKGETAAASGAFNAIANKYKGDAGGKTATESLKTAASAHTAEAASMEEYARGQLKDYGIPVPKGALASQMWDQVSAESAAFGGSMGVAGHGESKYGSLSDFSQNRALAGMGTSIQKVSAEIASGQGVLESINKSPTMLGNFAHQTKTDAMAGFESQAAKGEFSQANSANYGRDEQIDAAKVTANDALVKGVETAKGLVSSMAFNADGSIGKKEEFDKYAKGTEIGSRIAANKTMGAGMWANGKNEQETIDAMSDIQRTGAMGVASEVAKGRGFKNGEFGGNIDKFEDASTLIEQSKSDSMHGQAKGVDANYKVNPNMYSQNAQYSEESKQQTTDAKIKAQGGKVSDAVAVDVAESSIKATQQKDALLGSMAQHAGGGETGKKIADEILAGGTKAAEKMKDVLSSVGDLAHAQSASKTAGDLKTLSIMGESSMIESSKRDSIQQNAPKLAMLNLTNDGTKTQEMLSSYIGSIKDPKKREEAEESALSSGLASRRDKDGNLVASKGEAWVTAKSTLAAASMERDESFNLGGTRINASTDVGTGKTRSDSDSTQTAKTGDKEQVNVTDSGTLIAKAAAEKQGVSLADTAQAMEANVASTSPVRIMSAALASRMVKEKNQSDQQALVTPEDNDGSTPSTFLNDHAGTALTVATSALVGAGVASRIDRTSKFVAKEKIPITKSDLATGGFTADEDGGIKDKNGNEITEKDGRYYKKDGSVLEKPNPAKKTGPIERRTGELRKTGEDLRSFFSREQEPVGESTNKQNPDDSQGTSNNEKDKFKKHSDSLNKDNPIITDSEQKGSNISEQIDMQTKYDKTRNKMTDDFSKQNALNNGGTPEMIKRQQMQLDALDAAHDLNMGNKPPSFMDRMGTAMETSGGFRKKLGAMAFVMGAGAVAGEAGTLSSVTKATPSSTPRTTELSKEASDALQTASEVTGSAELGGGLVTLAAEAMSKFSSPAMGAMKSIAGLGAKVMPGVGIAYGVADSAHRLNNGDNLGASMSAGIAYASTLPGIGTGLAVAGGLAQIATDAMGITGVDSSPIPSAQASTNAKSTPLSQQGTTPLNSGMPNPALFSQDTGHNTRQAIQQNEMAMSQNAQAGNIATMTSLAQSRSGGFELTGADGSTHAFTTSKEQGNHLMVNGHDTGVGYKQFSGMMQNQDMAASFSNALTTANAEPMNAYTKTTDILQELLHQDNAANQRIRVSTNAAEINKSIQDKTLIQTIDKQGEKQEKEEK